MKMIIGGERVDASDGAVLEVVNPSTGAVVDTVPNATLEDVERAVDAAREGFRTWRKVPLHERISTVYRFTDLMAQNREQYAKLMAETIGKPYGASLADVDNTVDISRIFAEKARGLGGESFALGTEAGVERDFAFTMREPLGVAVCIVPFNYPAQLYAFKAIPALLMGNAVIVKPTTDVPLDNILFTEHLLEAGVPANAAQCVTGRGSTVGAWLAGSPKINAVSLTGSVKTGVEIAKAAAPNLTRVMLELGGNDATIICDDADLELAISEAVGGRLSNSGQTCCAPKRFVVDNKVRGEFVRLLAAAVAEVKVGDPFDPDVFMGPLVSEEAAVTVAQQVELTIAQGARLVCGGGRNGAFFEPTVLDDVTPAMDIARDMEVFGPVIPVIGYDTFDEAIELANLPETGLGGGIITVDVKKAMRAATEMECGTLVMNGTGNYRFSLHPFGGHKKSGIGYEGASVTLEEYSQLKTVALKKVLA
ncbi:MAG: aldehyde dehydrogenase family protein [Clostridiales Family XIII bacterium]|jgi:succinate-semialdehyde dehydrogenase/glutarate-semialdehyde dehydrogenase|nr:aldehyde dehydrogenase family protein [Clostridiales Family XIII bacterium]